MKTYAIPLENSDQMYVNGKIYRVIDVGMCDGGYILMLVDDEGKRASVRIEDGYRDAQD